MDAFSLLVPGILSFIVIIAATYSIERCGPAVGGVLSTLPHLIVINIAFIMIDAPDRSVVEEALFTVPIGVIGDGMYLLSWKYMPRLISLKHQTLKLTILVTSALIAWLIPCALFLLLFQYTAEHTLEMLPFIGIACAAITLVVGMITTWREPVIVGVDEDDEGADDGDGRETSGGSESRAKQASYKVLFARGIAAFVAAVICNYTASLGLGPLSGFMSIAPVQFIVAMVSLWLLHGDELPIQSAGSLLLGVTQLNIFPLATAWFYLFVRPFGDDDSANAAFSLSAAFVAAVLFGTVPAMLFLRYTRKRRIQR